MDLSEVQGISYWDNGRVRHNPDRHYTHEIDTITDLELIDGYMDWSKPKLLTAFHPCAAFELRRTIA